MNTPAGANPKADAVLDAVPAAVTLTFTEELTPGQTTVTVTGPDGAPASGDAAVAGATVSVPFKPTVPGAYKVAYRVTGHDGDATSNSLTFTLSPAAIPTTTTPPPTTTTTVVVATTPPVAAQAPEPAESGTPWWPFAVAALALVAVGVLLVVRRKGADS